MTFSEWYYSNYTIEFEDGQRNEYGFGLRVNTEYEAWCAVEEIAPIWE